ncbi:MAG: hypothetical protein RIB45_15335 [Marivibrio sp.]|uniref:hypothetical protein n=1 Tax=Marivibrio sp. TaxID=2039719 RepID=UPI0032EEF48E
MNPWNDVTLSLTRLGDGALDARTNPFGAQSLRERLELERADRKARARRRRQEAVEALSGAAAAAYRRLTVAYTERARRRLTQDGAAAA